METRRRKRALGAESQIGNVNMEPEERVTASPHLREDEDVAQSVGESFTNLLGAQSHSSGSQDQKQPRLQTDGWEPHPPVENSLYLKFQDSNLSPTLSLLPVISGVQHNFTEFSLFHQSDTEFAPLRAHPDISIASGRFDILPQDQTTHFSDHGSLSQHPLGQATILSEEGANSCFSLSQHSLSPSNQEKHEELGHPSMTVTTDNRQEIQSTGDRGSREKNCEILSNPRDKHIGEAAEDETFFLSKDIPARHLLKLLQKEVGMQSSSSSPVSSTSETSVKSTASFMDESKSTKISKLATNQGMIIRECPPGEAFLPQQHPKQPDRVSNTDQSQARSSEVFNIPMSSCATQPDDFGEVLHREQLSGGEHFNGLETQFKNKQQNNSSSSLTLSLKHMSEAKPSGIRKNMGDIRSTAPFLAGVEWVHREQDLWSSGNQTGIDGSYLGFLPQSQSTPGVFLAPPKSSVKPQFGKLSTIKSNKDNSDQSSTAIAAQPARSTSDTHQSVNQCQEDALQTSAEVQSLPSLNYMEKVDAWQANQNLGKTPLFNSLALQEQAGMSPKKKASDSVSDTLNRILTHQASSSQQSPVPGADSHKVAQSSSTAFSGLSSPRRGEAVGGAPSDKDKKGPAAPPSASPLGKSQSFSSLKTVVMSVHKHQQTDITQEREASQCQDNTHHHPSATIKHSPLMDLGHFSDVSLDQDLRLSCSLDSYSGIKVGASIGTSSVVSLELDNYAPYWTSKLSTPPPRPMSQELNIDERIPLYLHNLGINQSPSKILNPFVPRGAIREPEFSPTDLSTIKGSTGTPLKSTQPSDGGSPYKGEFSRSSILSVDSSVSIPFSLDSLGAAVSIPEQARVRTSPPSDTGVVQTEGRPAPRSQPDESPHLSTLQTSQQLQDISQIGDKSDSNVSLTTKAGCMGRKSESLLQSKHHVAQDSFVSTKARSEVCKLLSHAENVISARPSATSSALIASHLLSDENEFTSSEIKTSWLQNSSFSSTSTAEGLRAHTSDLWTRSSSDSMLTPEKKRQSSVGQEVMSSSQQIDNPPIQTVPAAPTTVKFKIPQDCSDVNSKGTSVVLSKSVQRTEPEGCSAAPPDNAPAQLQAIKPSSAVSTQQLTAAAVRGPEEEEKATLGVDALSRSSSPIIEEGDEEESSDGSSESSLAVRVAKLLQKESPATVVSSTPSITDQEESRAKEWVKLKTSERCELLELDIEDRKQIEEIKRELLLKNPLKSQGSTDTESSAASSVKVHKEQNAPESVETFSTLSDTNNHRGLSGSQPDSSAQLQSFPPDLEARVCEIADREGVTLPAKKPQAFTSVTIATCKPSTSPLPCSSPVASLSPGSDPLHLTELSTGTVRPTVANKQLPPNLDEKDRATLVQQTTRIQSIFDSSSRSVTSQSVPAKQKRRDTLGGQREELPSPFCGLEEDMIGNQELSDQTSLVSDVDHVANQATGPFNVGNPAWTGHHSHVRLSLSTKATDGTVTSAVHSSHAGAVSEQPCKAFVPLRDPSSAASSPDEGVGSSSPVEYYEPRGPDQSDATLFKKVPQGRATAKSLKSAVPHHRSDISARPATVPFAPVPVLLPYKPRGSEELFYVPQREADFSSEEPSDTTMESSHTGSDDAVPPHFSSEVLGHQDPGLDRGIAFRHTEGIYNKRLKTAVFKMQEPEHRDVSAAVERTSPTVSQTLKPSSQVSVPLTRVPSLNRQGVSKRDQGTSPVQFPQHEQSEPRVQSVHVEKVRTRVPQAAGEQDRQRTSLHQSAQRRSSSTLDQLWQKFCDRWTMEESHVASDGDASLVERLERLSRLIHGTRAADGSRVQEEEDIQPPQKLGRERERKEGREARQERRRGERGAAREVERIHLRLRAEKPLQPAENSRASPSSSFSHRSSQTSPALTDESEMLSTTSGSMSTVDTERLVRAFGAHRVQRLKSSSSLGKLYRTINKQREEGVHWTAGRKDPPHFITPSGTTGTDEAVASDSASTSSTYTLTSHRRPSRTLTAKRSVKLVNKSIQAGDLEIVSNGTRRHTRDVGTTFPSPGEARGFVQISSSSSSVVKGRPGGHRSPSKAQSNQKQRKNKRSPSKPYPEGVSWFISAENLKSEARKENRPEEPSAHMTTAWFEPYSRVGPWREPLRQRQVHEDRSRRQSFQRQDAPDPDPGTKTVSSALVPVSLQEALEMRRPEFIFRSRKRMQRLTQQVEERKLQAVFSRDGDEFFHQTGEAARLPRPAGAARLRRAVPRKEMIQRSKQIYEKLPEVQRRREEERRKAEYRSFRLNAQLYNKRITNRVLGRRSAWQ